jgi:modulator of FtsH protease
MSSPNAATIIRQTITSDRLVRQTYTLLGIIVAVAAAGAGIGLAVGLKPSLVTAIALMVVFIGGPFLLDRIKNGDTAIYAAIGWAGLTGFLLSAVVGGYLKMPGGNMIVLNALATTAIVFFTLSAYALVTRKDFSFMGGFLAVGCVVVFIAAIANIFFAMPMLSLVISGASVLLMSGFILYDTSRMIHDGEANCVNIAVSQFVNITILFMHLLRLYSFFAGDDE